MPFCLQEVEVTTGGAVVGYVLQQWSCLNPRFSICDQNKNPVLEIKGPICAISCCKDINFDVITPDGNEVGKITKQFSGAAKEYFTDADNFGIQFPMDLDVRCKLTLMAALFLIVSLLL